MMREIEDLKLQKKRLEQSLKDKDSELDELRQQVEEEKEKNKKLQEQLSNQKPGKGRKKFAAGPGGVTSSGKRRLAGENDDEEEEEEQEKKEMVDQCTGNGPGPGMEQEPLKVRGHSPRPWEELNKHGRCFSRQLRSEPSLLAGDLDRLPSPLVDSVKEKGRKDPLAQTWGGKSFRSTTPASKHGLAESWGDDPEPYLLQVWEHRKRGSKPAKVELLSLGATAPHKNAARAFGGLAQTMPQQPSGSFKRLLVSTPTSSPGAPTLPSP